MPYISLHLCIAILGAYALGEHDMGIGPIKKEIVLKKIDAKLAEKGKTIFAKKCTGCHRLERRLIGPALLGVTTRRRPEWIMNMILNPKGMLERDPTAIDLLKQYSAKMTFRELKQKDARAVLEFFRKSDETAPKPVPSQGDTGKSAPKPSP